MNYNYNSKTFRIYRVLLFAVSIFIFLIIGSSHSGLHLENDETKYSILLIVIYFATAVLTYLVNPRAQGWGRAVRKYLLLFFSFVSTICSILGLMFLLQINLASSTIPFVSVMLLLAIIISGSVSFMKLLKI